MSARPAIHPKMTVEEALERVPDALSVLLGFFGGCFLCPNVYKETLQECAEENSIAVGDVVKELKKLAASQRDGVS